MTWEDVAARHGMGTTTLPYRPHGTDKGAHGYMAHYERLLGARQVGSLVELGVQSGASLVMWGELLPDARVAGVEHDPACGALDLEGVEVLIADAADGEATASLAGPWDVIVDDGSHLAAHTAANLAVWAPRLAPGGLYVVEDVVIGSTSWVQSLDEVVGLLLAHGLTPLAVERSRVPWVAHDRYGGMMSVVFADAEVEVPC